MDSHFLKPNFDSSFVYNSCPCPDWLLPESYPRQQQILSAFWLFLPHEDHFHSLTPQQTLRKHLLRARERAKGTPSPILLGPPKGSYDSIHWLGK